MKNLSTFFFLFQIFKNITQETSPKEKECMENIYEDFIIRKGESVRNDKAINLEEAISCGSRVFFTLWENFSTPASTAALKGTCRSLIFHVNVLAVI